MDAQLTTFGIVNRQVVGLEWVIFEILEALV
jgi:hypothetical protein